MLAIDRELKALVDSFNEKELPYALCGGLALAVHGSPRATLDIDVVALTGSAPALKSVAQSLGFTLEAAAMKFANDQVEIMRISKVSGDSEDVLALDILTLSEGLESEISVEEKVWEGSTLWVLDRASLIRLKELRRSAQDIADIEKLNG